MNKFDEIYVLLRDYDFASNTNVPTNLKCVHCRKIAIIPCQVPCGCRFCKDCVNELINNGLQNCPGSKIDCLNESLLNFQMDYIGNKLILDLIVKCPEPICSFECKLSSMSIHFKNCDRKLIKCPYYEFGCTSKELEENLEKHVEMKTSSHNFLMLTALSKINNLVTSLLQANENLVEKIDLLKSSEENNINEIEYLKKILKENHLSIQEEPDIRISNEERKREISSIFLDGGVNVDGARRELANIDNEQISTLITNSVENISMDWKRELDEQISKVTDDFKLYKQNLETRLSRSTFAWKIDKLDQLNKTGGRICSDFFYGSLHQYRMKLELDERVTHLLFYLRVYPDYLSTNLSWPFQANITMNLVSKTPVYNCTSVKKLCIINRPETIMWKFSEPFTFSYFDIHNNGYVIDNSITLECFLEFVDLPEVMEVPEKNWDKLPTELTKIMND